MAYTIDITDRIGQIGSNAEWPMYSHDRAAYMLWNAIANGLAAKGWTEEQIKDWLQSKSARWALDGDLGDAISKLGTEYANTIVEEVN